MKTRLRKTLIFLSLIIMVVIVDGLLKVALDTSVNPLFVIITGIFLADKAEKLGE